MDSTPALVSVSRTFSVDVETNKMFGKLAFAIGAVVLVDGVVLAEFEGRAPTPRATSPWVKENVLPSLKDMSMTHDSVRALEEAFWSFWMTHRTGASTVAYFGNQGGETALFHRLIMRDYKNRWTCTPSPLHELCTLMIACGYKNIHRYDLYAKEHGLKPTCTPQSFHHPLYDAHVAALVWDHLIKHSQRNAR